jgi:hypothetical protein
LWTITTWFSPTFIWLTFPSILLTRM